jgi:hypothetical protein
MNKVQHRTCYGCPYYYSERPNDWPMKHCVKDHWNCAYYLGIGNWNQTKEEAEAKLAELKGTEE